MTPGHGEASLHRGLGFGLAVLIAINSTIGTGIFKKPAVVAQLTDSLTLSFAVWIAGAVIALCGALTLAELGAAMPRTGGIYEYIRRAWGPQAAFMVGWTKLTLLMPSAIGSFARLASESAASMFGRDGSGAAGTLGAVCILAGCAGVNLLGVRQSASQQGVLTVIKYVGVLALGAAGVLLAPASAPDTVTVATTASALPWMGMFAALVSVMWAYDGWADVSAMAGEVREPRRTLPRALVAGTVLIAALYLVANVGYARVLGLDGLQASTTGANMAGANLAFATLGEHGRTLLSALVFVSCTGACMASLLTGSRMLVPVATDGLFPPVFARVSERSGVPYAAVIGAASLGALYVCWRTFEQLTDSFVVGYFPFYILAVLAVFKLRRTEPELDRPFRVPLYPVVPLVFLLGATALLVGACSEMTGSAWFAFGVMGAGIPLSLVATRVASRRVLR